MATRSRSIAGLLAAVALAACSSAPASPSPEPTPPDGATFLLRVTNQQALPPDATFSWTPQIVITLDGRVLQGGAVPAIFPGPLLQPISARQLSASGWTQIVAVARNQGLLSGANDFTGGNVEPGSTTTRVQIVADGRLYDLTGPLIASVSCATPPCAPQPGSPAAFTGFTGAVRDPEIIVGPSELGPSAPYVPEGYAILVGPVPDDQGVAQPPIAWPLAAGFAQFGKPLADGSGRRCGVATGADAAGLRGAFAAATSVTKWRDPVDGSFHGLTVRSLLPGDGDPCAGLV
ncbi:MAG TPA: hypothetical protein VJ850_05795 [Candidatus Limnocylindrales bacterium]|nr:hypothetical protein [Candidatus Limnocylindrales bacterium]